MQADDVCPVCGGPRLEAQHITVCGGCARTVLATGAIAVTTTMEFAAVPPPDSAPSGLRSRTDSGIPLCTWCAKPRSEVKKLLSGGGANICNECVALCADVLLAELGDDWR
jgi:hypothetical protein